MFSKLGKTSMSVLTGAMFAIAAASLVHTSLWHSKKTPSARSFTNSAGMVMTKILASTFKFKMDLVEDSDKVLYDGCYFSLLNGTTSAFRINFVPAKPFESIGIRVVCSCNGQSFTYASQKEQTGFWT